MTSIVESRVKAHATRLARQKAVVVAMGEFWESKSAILKESGREFMTPVEREQWQKEAEAIIEKIRKTVKAS